MALAGTRVRWTIGPQGWIPTADNESGSMHTAGLLQYMSSGWCGQGVGRCGHGVGMGRVWAGSSRAFANSGPTPCHQTQQYQFEALAALQ